MPETIERCPNCREPVDLGGLSIGFCEACRQPIKAPARPQPPPKHAMQEQTLAPPPEKISPPIVPVTAHRPGVQPDPPARRPLIIAGDARTEQVFCRQCDKYTLHMQPRSHFPHVLFVFAFVALVPAAFVIGAIVQIPTNLVAGMLFIFSGLLAAAWLIAAVAHNPYRGPLRCTNCGQSPQQFTPQERG